MSVSVAETVALVCLEAETKKVLFTKTLIVTQKDLALFADKRWYIPNESIVYLCGSSLDFCFVLAHVFDDEQLQKLTHRYHYVRLSDEM